jgi:virginiamycin B lyase
MMAKSPRSFTPLLGGAIAAVLLAVAPTAMAQTITEFAISTGNSGPTGITSGPDGAMWFTEATANKIGRISATGIITEYALATPNSEPLGITSGPDGALWFTEGAAKIGRITTSGTITEFPIPNLFDPGSALEGPIGITAGPDGALWFTDTTNCIGPMGGCINFIGRVTTEGDFTEYSQGMLGGGALGGFPSAITAGPDGALWFIENLGCGAGSCPTAIQRITTAGIITGYVLPNDEGAAGITAGPDNSLWFTGGGGPLGAFIGQITTAGIITEYPLTSIISPQGITTGSDGSLWFTGGVAGGQVVNGKAPGAIGQIISAGVVTGYPIPISNSSPQGIAAGSGGTIWFTDPGTNAIGTFATTARLNPLVAAILPESRSVEVDATATAFATMINTGTSIASTCSIASQMRSLPASFLFQTTDPTTNVLTGTPNTPANISAGASQSFVIAFTPSGAFGPTDVPFNFTCANAATASVFPGINTLNLSVSSNPVPDIVALAASADPGYVDIPGATGTGDFAVATVNLGSAAQITASANTGTTSLPVTLTICQTDPQTGNCLALPTATVTTTISANATPTFAIFVTGSGPVADLPGINRVFVQFSAAGGVLRGQTSVAVRTP